MQQNSVNHNTAEFDGDGGGRVVVVTCTAGGAGDKYEVWLDLIDSFLYFTFKQHHFFTVLNLFANIYQLFIDKFIVKFKNTSGFGEKIWAFSQQSSFLSTFF